MNGRRKIRVLHIITNLPVGGAQDNTLLTVEMLDRSKYDVSLMCANEGGWVERAREIPNLDLIFVNEFTRPVHVIRDIIAFWKIYKAIKQSDGDNTALLEKIEKMANEDFPIIDAQNTQ